MRSGCTLVSGGAVGADSVAVGGASLSGDPSRCVVILPYGLEHCVLGGDWCAVSVCEPGAAFSTGQAMERNALIYSFGRRAVVVRPRYREGGTWHGAVDALRRRLGALWVLDSPPDRASRAIVSLGALALHDVDDLPRVLSEPLSVAQPDLFGATRVRESSDLSWRAGA